MDLEIVLKNRNANDEIYLSDVHQWIGIDKPVKLAIEIKSKLDEIKEKIKW